MDRNTNLLEQFRAIFLAYDRAAADPNALLPSVLTAAIVAARMVVGPLISEQQMNDYANAAIKRDKEEPRWLRDMREGRPDTPPGY